MDLSVLVILMIGGMYYLFETVTAWSCGILSQKEASPMQLFLSLGQLIYILLIALLCVIYISWIPCVIILFPEVFMALRNSKNNSHITNTNWRIETAIVAIGVITAIIMYVVNAPG